MHRPPPGPLSRSDLRGGPRTDVPFPSLLGAFAPRLLTTIRAQQRAGGALSESAFLRTKSEAR